MTVAASWPRTSVPSHIRIRVPPLKKVLQNHVELEDSGYVAGACLLRPLGNRILAEVFVHCFGLRLTQDGRVECAKIQEDVEERRWSGQWKSRPRR